MPAEDHHILKTYFPASASYSFTFNVFFWSLICSWETSLLEQFLYHHMSWWALVANIEQLWYHFMNIWAALVIEHHVSWWEQWCHLKIAQHLLHRHLLARLVHDVVNLEKHTNRSPTPLNTKSTNMRSHHRRESLSDLIFKVVKVEAEQVGEPRVVAHDELHL